MLSRFALRGLLRLAIAFFVLSSLFLTLQAISQRLQGATQPEAFPIKSFSMDPIPNYIPDAEVEDMCATYWNWPYPERKTRKVYDLFLTSTEMDWLEIRFNTLSPYVDYFVIVESSKTFTNQDKPLYFRENIHRFEKFKDQIIYRTINFTSVKNDTAWAREEYQRNALYTEVFPTLEKEQAANLGDVLIVSDVDEIPKPETVVMLRNCKISKRVTIRSSFYYYSFQWLHRVDTWQHPQATFFQGSHTILPSNLRGGGGYKSYNNAGWHCSSCFSTIAEINKKIESYSHTEFNKAEFKDPEQIVRRVRKGLDLFDREGQDYNRVENNTDLPSYLKNNREKYPWLVDRDPPNANFLDFEPKDAGPVRRP